MVEAVLFDFDGTLADTAPDLGGALNLLLRRYDKPQVSLSRSRPLVSMGARGMLQIGFGVKPDHAEYEALKTEYLALYEANLCRETRLFDGIGQVLDALETRTIPWGIVTNKHSRFTTPLLAALNISQRVNCVVTGDSVTRLKPDPEGLIAAAKKLNLPPSKNIVYVGDDERDIQAAIAAQMTPVIARYGYLGNDNPPAKWGTALMIDSPNELLQALGIH